MYKVLNYSYVCLLNIIFYNYIMYYKKYRQKKILKD